MRTTFLHKNSTKYLLGILCIFLLSHNTAFANGETYYHAKLTVKANATGAGKVYIETPDTYEKQSSSTEKTIPFTVGATPSEGYDFHEWTITEGTATINDGTKITITASSTTESTPTSATATANFKREPITFDEPSGSWGNTIVTWKQPYLDGTITFPITNEYTNEIIKKEDFSSGNTSLNNPQIGYNYPIVSISGTDPLYKLPSNGSRDATFTLVATPDKGALTEGENTEKTYSATLNESLFNLTPIFTISSSRIVQTEPNKPHPFSIQPTDYGTLPINDVTWTASLSDESVFTLTSPNPIGGNCYLTYNPTAIGTHSATITLTATFTDAHTKVWTYTQTCSLNGNCFEDKDPEIQIQQGGVNQPSATYELITNESTTSIFDITSFGVNMESITANSSDGTIIQPTLSADKSSLTLSINSLSAPGTQDITITVSGTTTIGENVGSTISTILTVTIRRWFNTMTVTTNPDATSMTLTWTSAGPEVTSYQILRGSTVLAEVDKNTRTYTDKGLTADNSYTYTIKAIASGAEYSVHINTNTTSVSSILKLNNCPEMFTITGVDASAAFDNKGKALMDRVYIMNKNNATRCHIYDKSDETTYTLTNTVNPQLEEGRAGRFIGKKIYIAGTCESLYWNSGDCLGWMQPVNCDIYLDNVRLSAANNEELFTVYDFIKQINGDGGENSIEDFSCVYKKASVFYLPENSGNTANTSTIHLRGKNYLGGNMAGKPKINMDVMGSYSGATVYIPVRYVMSNFSAPIAIKDSILFTSDGTTNHPFDKNKVLSNTTKRPQIICQFDAVWADGAIKNDGYLDLSTRTSTLPDVTIGGTHMADRCIIDETGYSEAFGTKTPYPTKIWGHSYLPHLRYEAPLVTGGEHGTFIINGGQINLWPANGYTLDGYIQRTPLVLIPVLNRPSGNLIMRSGKSTNYMACGNSLWSLNIKGTDTEIFQESSDGILSFFDKASATCGLYGIGDGYPQGTLIVNGGTISANTDEDSYGYTTGQPNVDDATVVNANGTKQPLFGPNVQINGGTFQWPLYGAKKNPHGTGKAFYGPEGESVYNRAFIGTESDSNDHGKVRPPCGYDKPTTQKWDTGTLHNYTDYNTDGSSRAHQPKTYTIDWTWSILEWDESEYQAINQYAQSVSRAAYALPEANTDYTAFNEINTTTEPEAHNPLEEEGKKAVMGNAGTDKEYLYGMTNVWSDDKALGYFYLPEERSGIMQNYYIKSTDEPTAFTQTKQGEVASTHFPYHLWIDKGGEISVADNYVIHGRPHYRATYTEDTYQTIAMPFTANRFFVTDPWDDQFRFYSYVEVNDANAAGVPEADRIAINNNAYCYLYFLDDEATNPEEDDDIVHDQRAKGVNNTFRSYYHTHTDGSTMQAGKTYVIKFPKVDDTNYWGTNTVTLQGEKGQTILGKNGFTFATRPEATANDALNPSFIMDGNTTFATQDISGKGEVYLVDPAQWGNDSFHATTASTLAPMQGYLVGSANTMQRYRIIGREGKVEQTALDQLIHTGWTAVGAHQAMLIMTPQDATAHIYTAEGKLWKTISLTANTGVVVNAPAGFYIVHTGNESKKVLVH